MTPGQSVLNGKVRSIDSLAELLAAARKRGQRTVHCHGVFDLLHIGHIRHFEEAKRFGDVLVVTITPDRYVNKGPHRPAFNEQLRAEAAAALACVDFVAINEWPTAVETIYRLRPDLYVKGSEYIEAHKDRTKGIVLEEAAITAVGGQLQFTQDITFSSSSLINRHLSPFPSEVCDYLRAFSTKHSSEEILECLDAARALKVLIVGEAIVDEYHYCEAIGKSSKEPTLVVRGLSTEKFAGGALAVANIVAGFCDQVGLVTFLGTESSEEGFIRENLQNNIDATVLYQQNAPTIVKKRFVENYFLNKLFEEYTISDGVWADEDHARLCTKLREEVGTYDVVIVTDYGHGMLDDCAVTTLCQEARFLAVNTQSNAGNAGFNTISKYPKAAFVSLAENEIRLDLRNRRADLQGLVSALVANGEYAKIVVTRGKHGSLGYSMDEGFVETPALAWQVVDRIGSGDACLAVTSLCVAQGAPMDIVGFVGNAVGAQAVGMVGHRDAITPVGLGKHIAHILK